MPSIGMFVYGEVEHDARVRRAAATLVDAGFSVVIGCLGEQGPASLDGARIEAVQGRTSAIGTSPLLKGTSGPVQRASTAAGWILRYAWGLVVWRRALARRMPAADAWIGHDLFGLWAAAWFQGRHGGRLIYDSHELFLEAGSATRLPAPLRRLLARFERRLARRADAVITVNDSIAAELVRRYAVRPIVVLNVPRTWRKPHRDPFPSLVGSGRRVVLYHGALSRGRGIEELVSLAPQLPDDSVVVILGSGQLLDELDAATQRPPVRGRVYVHPQVAIDDLPDWVGNAAVGIVAFQPTTLNNRLATPNKLFDYLLAGVPVVASDFPELRRIIREIDGGLTCDPSDPRALADGIAAVLAEPRWMTARARADLAQRADRRYGWSIQGPRLISVVEGVLRR